ncbi:MAG: penicillin-binding protein 2 [Clostridium sp.]|nr:penicillin-binding protein 2 [Clostridium sp.]
MKRDDTAAGKKGRLAGFAGFRRKRPQKEIRSRADQAILGIAYVVSGVFLAMAVYFGWFIQFDSEDVIGSPYNARLDRFSDRIVRGRILSNDGQTLAETLVDTDGTETRRCPFDSLFVHAVGYCGLNGRTGLEAQANYYLLTSHVNLLEKVFCELKGEKCPGDQVVTTLDADLQRAAAGALGNRAGAVIAMEPDTGKILAMVSQPGFDANQVDEIWEALISPDNTAAQLVNRATQGRYPPGSTFKILTALEFMRENPDTWQDFTFHCTGVFQSGDYTIRCFHSEAHGDQNLIQAFAGSCNGAFAQIGLSLDAGRFKGLAESVLFNSPLPYPMPYNESSFVMDEDADEWERLQTAIGQGRTQMTPLHNLLLIAAIANGGTLMRPYMMDHVENVGGQTIRKFLPSAYGSLMSASDAAFLSELLKQTVEIGTGSALKTDRYTAAGKTGSAEFETGKETHSWFVGYAPAENPAIAISVIAEEAGSGGQVAAPVARAVFDAYFAKQGAGSGKSE